MKPSSTNLFAVNLAISPRPLLLTSLRHPARIANSSTLPSIGHNRALNPSTLFLSRSHSTQCCRIDTMSTSSQPGPSGQQAKTPVYIQEVTPEITTFDYPFSRFGILPIGGRSIAIKMRDGRLWVVPSTPLDEPTKAKIDAMGEVAYLVAPDNVHHLFLKDFHQAYPAAKVVGTQGHEEKRPDVKFSGIYGRDSADTKYGYEEEFVPQYFPTFANRDVAFLHKDSKTLITADLLFNLPCRQQYRNTPSGKPTSWIPGVIWFSKLFNPHSAFHKSFLGSAGVASTIPGVEKGGSTEERKKNFAEAASAVAKWDFRRIIMLHGDIIENHGQEAWRAAFSKYLDAEGNSKFKSS